MPQPAVPSRGNRPRSAPRHTEPPRAAAARWPQGLPRCAPGLARRGPPARPWAAPPAASPRAAGTACGRGPPTRPRGHRDPRCRWHLASAWAYASERPASAVASRCLVLCRQCSVSSIRAISRRTPGCAGRNPAPARRAGVVRTRWLARRAAAALATAAASPPGQRVSVFCLCATAWPVGSGTCPVAAGRAGSGRMRSPDPTAAPPGPPNIGLRAKRPLRQPGHQRG